MRTHASIIIAVTALVVAVFGSTPIGEAAWNQVVPRNSVGTLQLKRNAVTSSKIAPNAIRGSQVVDGSLLTGDFKAGQIPQGPKGDKGEKGDRGERGPVGISGYEIVTGTSNVSANTTLIAATATCPVGKRVLGGTQSSSGGTSNGIFYNTNVDLFMGRNRYFVIVHNSTTTARTITVKAICAIVAG
jgi:hypothetical protein